jgi:DNA-binding FrmR family transcriptional regulator
MTVTTPAADAGAPPGYTGHKADHLARLARIGGQVRGVTRMVQDDRYCTDVLTQISAITRALQEVALGLLDDHVRHCVIGAARVEPGAGEQKAAELTGAVRRLVRA